MKATIAKVALRVIGTLIALWALATLCGGLLFLKIVPTEFARIVLLPVALVYLPVVIWCFYIGYLVWADFSTRVIRHVCGVLCLLGFYSLWKHTIAISLSAQPSPWTILACISLIITACAVHRIVSKQLNHWLFPEFG